MNLIKLVDYELDSKFYKWKEYDKKNFFFLTGIWTSDFAYIMYCTNWVKFTRTKRKLMDVIIFETADIINH